MAFFVVAYDLVTNPGDPPDYADLTAMLKTMDYCHPQDSVWLVQTDDTAQNLYDQIDAIIGIHDRLMVIEFERAPAWVKAFPESHDWLTYYFGGD